MNYDGLKDVPIGDLIEVFIKIRDKRDEINEEYKAKLAKAEERMTAIKAVILEKAREVGTDSFKVNGVGTAFIKPTSKFTCSDASWPDFYKWIWEQAMRAEKEDGNGWQFIGAYLQKRPMQKTLGEFFKENGYVPNGINVHTELDIMIRRAS